MKQFFSFWKTRQELDAERPRYEERQLRKEAERTAPVAQKEVTPPRTPKVPHRGGRPPNRYAYIRPLLEDMKAGESVFVAFPNVGLLPIDQQKKAYQRELLRVWYIVTKVRLRVGGRFLSWVERLNRAPSGKILGTRIWRIAADPKPKGKKV